MGLIIGKTKRTARGAMRNDTIRMRGLDHRPSFVDYFLYEEAVVTIPASDTCR
jgi:hypothetical protein